MPACSILILRILLFSPEPPLLRPQDLMLFFFGILLRMTLFFELSYVMVVLIVGLCSHNCEVKVERA